MPAKRRTKTNQREKTLFFVTVLLTTLIGAIWLLKDYLSIIFLSVIFAIVVHPLYILFQEKLKIRKGFSTLLTIIVAFFLIILPIILSANLFAQEIGQLVAETLTNRDSTIMLLRDYVASTNTLLAQIPLVDIQVEAIQLDRTVTEFGANISGYILDRAVAIGTTSVNVVINFFLFLILTYFIIPVLPDMKKYVLHLSPLDDKVDEIYIDRLIALIISMIKSIFIIALAQGLLGGVFLWVAGSSYILTLTIMMIILSIIPIVGTGFVTVPVGLYMLAQGNYAGATIILLGQFIFVSNIDNILRAELLSRDTSLHPAVMLLGIFGGLQVFGAIGLLYGPIIIILFLTSLEIYTEHYKY